MTRDPAAEIRRALEATGAVWEETAPARFAVQLPGERKQRTVCSLAVGDHSLPTQISGLTCVGCSLNLPSESGSLHVPLRSM